MGSIAEDKNYSLFSDYIPKMRYTPDMDFAEWQKTARAKLADLLGMNLYKNCEPKFNIEYKKETETYIEYRFTIQSKENYYVPSVMRVPRGMEVGKHPLLLCLQGDSRASTFRLEFRSTTVINPV